MTGRLATGLAFLALAGCAPELEMGRADFQAFCAGCHGEDGRGTGWAAAGLARQPADLTGIAARNGGRFDYAAVMSRIDGYGLEDPHAVMPEFGPLFEGDTVLVDLGDGIPTPTPVRLLAVAEYLETIQEVE